MKEKELRKLAKCSRCRRTIGELRIPLFYKIVVSRYGLNIAQAMSPNEDLAEKLMEEKTMMICEECSSEKIVLGHILQRGRG